MIAAKGHWPPKTTMDAPGLFFPIMTLAKLAMRFGRIDRTAVRHADGVTPESDSDHTVMLSWLAPALADRCCEGLDIGLVTQFAVLHDAPEVLAGDTSTLRISARERVAKAGREASAAEVLAQMFGSSLPWFPGGVLRYEQQIDPEARFVRAVDKLVVKLVHLIDRCSGIRGENVLADEFLAMATTQRESLKTYAEEFPGLLSLHAVLCGEVEARLRELELPAGVPDNAAARAVTKQESGHVDFVCDRDDESHREGRPCQFCDGGLFSCAVCGSFEGATTTHCPGVRMTAEQHDDVYAGKIDFRRDTGAGNTVPGPDGAGLGHWVNVGSPHTPNSGWLMSGAFAESNQALDAALATIDAGDFEAGTAMLREGSR